MPDLHYQQWKHAAKQMIYALPEGGATIIVLTNAIGQSLKRGIVELRDKELARRCRMISIQHRSDCDKIIGLRGHIVVDASFTEAAKPEVIALVERTVARIRVMQSA